LSRTHSITSRSLLRSAPCKPCLPRRELLKRDSPFLLPLLLGQTAEYPPDRRFTVQNSGGEPKTIFPFSVKTAAAPDRGSAIALLAIALTGRSAQEAAPRDLAVRNVVASETKFARLSLPLNCANHLDSPSSSP